MRKLGMIGGMSWISTAMYYEHINREVKKHSPPLASAPLIIESHDFELLAGLRDADDWSRAGDVLAESARRLESAGAEGLIICANSMHRVYDRVAGSVGIPIIHITECIGQKMAKTDCKTAALIGTRNVMTESFYRQRLVAHGIDLLPPDMSNVEALDRIIYEELMTGKATREAERTLRTIITKRAQDGAQAIVLACTELDMVVDVDANILPVFDSTRIHCNAAAEWILGREGE